LGYIHKKFIFVEQNMDQIKLYNILRANLKLSDAKAAEFVSAMGTMAEREFDAKIQTLATKDDLRELSLATKNDIRELALATKNDIRELSLSSKNDIRDLYKTIYLSGLVQFIAIVGSVVAIVKFMR
jgi:hypothetical protein